MKLILNASPLIHIVRAGFGKVFVLLKESGIELIVPREVVREVVEKGENYADSAVVQDLIEKGVIKVADVKIENLGVFLKTHSEKSLHKGEVEVLFLAKKLNGIAIIDEKPARAVGKILGIEVRGSVYLLMLLFKNGLMSKKEVVNAFKSMVKTGYRLSSRDFAIIIEKLEKL